MKKDGMKVGDLIEFLSDSQTEKGPSSGSIIDIDKDQETGIQISIIVKHSDCPKEVFHCSHLKVNRRMVLDNNKVLWQCE